MKKTVIGQDALDFYAAFGYEAANVDVPVAEVEIDDSGFNVTIYTALTIMSLAITSENDTVFTESYLDERVQDEYRLTKDNGFFMTEIPMGGDGEPVDITPQDASETAQSIELLRAMADAAYKAAKPYMTDYCQSSERQKQVLQSAHPRGLH